MKTIPNVSVYRQKFPGYIRIKVSDVNEAKILFLRIFFSCLHPKQLMLEIRPILFGDIFLQFERIEKVSTVMWVQRTNLRSMVGCYIGLFHPSFFFGTGT